MPEKDLDEIRETFSYISRRAKPRRVLEEAMAVQRQQKASSSTDGTENGSNNYAEFDIRKILKDEDDGTEEFKRDPSLPYSL
ncbi:xyloglucan 6-xylosyltransferase 2-like [Olea europaea subsp. europaea]|uniref:Xyloglucan 6-xylosyltransferase 2-like n=1 Tax=Olea europaea subsp. europaea TaxID=158383 RepID=A0A8S0S011_OLEEU|nr:xyloglucan 6-xylosyltransferase 2-like [Olea europaea subsp. europaea]